MTQAESTCVLLCSMHVWHKHPQECWHVHSTCAFTQCAGCLWQIKGHAYIPQPCTPKRKKHIEATAVVSSADAMEGASRKKDLIYLDEAKGPQQERDFSSASVR